MYVPLVLFLHFPHIYLPYLSCIALLLHRNALVLLHVNHLEGAIQCQMRAVTSTLPLALPLSLLPHQGDCSWLKLKSLILSILVPELRKVLGGRMKCLQDNRSPAQVLILSVSDTNILVNKSFSVIYSCIYFHLSLTPVLLFTRNGQLLTLSTLLPTKSPEYHTLPARLQQSKWTASSALRADEETLVARCLERQCRRPKAAWCPARSRSRYWTSPVLSRLYLMSAMTPATTGGTATLRKRRCPRGSVSRHRSCPCRRWPLRPA